MTTKVIAAIIAAIGLGFAGTYFATSSGSCSDGGCPLSRMLGIGSSKTAAPASDCCNPASECCDPPSACCGTAAKAKAGCCTPGAACCEPGAACCEDKAAKAKTEPKTEPVSTEKK